MLLVSISFTIHLFHKCFIFWPPFSHWIHSSKQNREKLLHFTNVRRKSQVPWQYQLIKSKYIAFIGNVTSMNSIFKKVNTVHKRLLKSKEIQASTVRLFISFWMVPSQKEGLTGIHLQTSPLPRLVFFKPVNNVL